MHGSRQKLGVGPCIGKRLDDCDDSESEETKTEPDSLSIAAGARRFSSAGDPPLIPMSITLTGDEAEIQAFTN